MSIVPMKKMQLVIHKSNVDAALAVVQDVSAVEFSPSPASDLSTTIPLFPYEHLLPRLQQSVQFLDSYIPQPTWRQVLLEGVMRPVGKASLQEHLDNADLIQTVVEDVESLQLELASQQDERRLLEEQIDFLHDWELLPYALSGLETVQTKTFLVEVSSMQLRQLSFAHLNAALEDFLVKDGVDCHIEQVTNTRTAVTVLRSQSSATTALLAIVKHIGAEIIQPPLSVPETAKKILSKMQATLAELSAKESELHGRIASFAGENVADLKIKADVLQWQADRFAVLAGANATDSSMVLHGWVNGNRLAQLEEKLQAANVLYVLETHDPDPEEEQPVEIENNRFIRPFEVVTRLYGLPGHRDLDPTVFLAGFFFLFFGLSLTDVGYGVFLMTAALLLIFVFKVAPVVKQFAALLFLMGLSSSLVGLLFGGYLGVDPASLPAALQAVQQFDPIGNPLPVFYLALALGVVQVMFGLVLKIVSEAKNNRLVGGLLDQGPWLALFVILIMYGLAWQDVWAGVYMSQFETFIYVAIAAIVVTSGRHGEGVLQKIQYSLLSLYQSIGYFSDILSYSRLLALGLATTALAFAVNLIADIVRESVPYLGVVLAIVVLVVGHLFTLAVNTLGAFIHSARLQFVEFFGKFISGTGRTFQPLSRRESFVTLVDDTKH